MRKAKIEELTRDAFAPFGYFANMIDPDCDKIGAAPVEFYRDMLQVDLGGSAIASFSICRVEQRGDVVEKTEFHSSCGEGNLPLDADILIHVAPAGVNGVIPYDKIRIFYVPRGTMIVIKPGVWHHAPIIADKKTKVANTLIVLPERTYANDCQGFKLKKSEQTKIVR